MDRDVLFCVFTTQKLAVPIFYTKHNLSDSEVTQVALKSTMPLSMMTSSELENTEAILPFLGLAKKRIGFIYLFQINQKDPVTPHCVAALIYLVPHEQQAFLYSKVPFLKHTAEDIALKIKQQFIYGESTLLSNELQSFVNDWLVTDKDTTTHVQIIEKRVTYSERTEGGNLDFLFSQIKKNDDKLLGALYRGNPVLVTGESQVMIDLIVHSIDLFIPQTILRKVSYTEDIIDPKQADIIGISKKLVKRYPQELLIDSNKKQVKNGQTCNYSKEVLKQIRKEPARADTILTQAYTQILEVANLLIDVFTYPEEKRQQLIVDVRNKHDESLIEVAVDLAAKRNPLIRELLFQQVSSRFMDWIDDF
ncbi:MAG: hypothetical protein ACW98I_14020 [Candidatus Hodarchaeales archaeon]